MIRRWLVLQASVVVRQYSSGQQTNIRTLLKSPDLWASLPTILQKQSLTTQNKLQLLKAIAKGRRSDQIGNSIAIFTSLMKQLESGEIKLTSNAINQCCFNFITSFTANTDFCQLVHLKFLYHTYIHRYCSMENLDLIYIQAYVNSLINAKLHDQAIELFEQAVASLTPSSSIFQTLPSKRILDLMCLNHDFDRLARWLHLMQETNYTLPEQTWLKYLNLGLENSNYQVVKLIYDDFIMEGLDEGITRKDAVISTGITERILSLITDEEINAILHVFSINGDVDLTLQLIESHFIHKSLTGEKALTNDLCVNVVASYCYHRRVLGEGEDDSLKRILDVINGFILHLPGPLNAITYQDLTSSFSYKFNNFHILDENVVEASRTRNMISNSILNQEENLLRQKPVLPRKITNVNIHSSNQGNVLANLQILRRVLEDHITYIIEKNYTIETIRIFINCVLNHVSLYQNFSGIVLVLTTLKYLNKDMVHQWLDNDSLLIISHSLSTSVGSKLTSLEVFKHLKKSKSLDHKTYLYLIEAADRGNDFHSLLEFYIYNYLRAFDGDTSPKLVDMVKSTGRHEALLQFIQTRPANEAVDRFWTDQGLNSEEPVVTNDDSQFARRKYNYYIDVRDAESLKHVFSDVVS